MSQSRARAFAASDFLRSLPTTLGALLAIVLAIDILLAFQPTWLDELSRSYRSAVAMRPLFASMTHVLAASLAVASVVVSSAVLLGFSRAVAVAPHASLAPAWIALCMLSVVRVQSALPLPMSLPLFAGLSALAFVGAGVALCSGSRAGAVFGWMLVALPIVVFGASYANVSLSAYPFGRDAAQLSAGLSLSALGVVLLAFMHKRSRPSAEVPGLEGVDLVEELFAQVERAERSEARVAQLEHQLNAFLHPQTGEPRVSRARAR